jgi:hypothetical protein
MWKRNEGPQPVCPTTGLPLTKPPKVPTKLKKYLRCHCHQNGVNMRTGKTCAMKCIVDGRQYKTGACPLCKCVCHLFVPLDDLFVPLDDYRAMIIANSLEPSKYDSNDRLRARDWLLKGTNVNRIQQEVSAQTYGERTWIDGTGRCFVLHRDQT